MLARQLVKVYQSFVAKSPEYQNYTHLTTHQSLDLSLNLHEYEHKLTKARIFHFQNKDPQRVYASIIKTFAQNDKGCPHILEHLVCCGSEKYPIRDPFFNMIQRSVNTYMNAWTGDDFTCYPFSSANPKDFENLLDVYLDMSLKPLLSYYDFRQEGWRYEINQQNEKQLKGIVLNEMKGAYQQADRQLLKEISLMLYQGTPYIHETGGKPQEIVNLQYEELVEMYKYYYHPSNMGFYFYGQQNIQSQLHYLNSSYLSKYQDHHNKYQNILLKPHELHEKYKTTTTQSAESNSICINFYLGNNQQIPYADLFALRILNYILLSKSNALVYQEFVESGIAKNIGDYSGLNEGKLVSWHVFLKGIYQDYDHKDFQDKFRNMMQQLMKGLNFERVQQYRHTFEIGLLTPRENNGIRILEDCMYLMNHKLSLEPYLHSKRFLSEAIENLKQPEYLSQLVQKYFLKNSHFCIVKQVLGQESQEKPIVSKISMDKETILQQQEKLIQRQSIKQNVDVLPKLLLEDLIKPERKTPILVEQINKNDKIFEHYHVGVDVNLNFYRLCFTFEEIQKEMLQKIALWTYSLNKSLSTASFTYKELVTKINSCMSKFNVFHQTDSKTSDKASLKIIFQFDCLKQNVQKSFNLISQMILSPKFEKDNTLNIFQSYKNQTIENLINNPMGECLNQGGSNLTMQAMAANSYQRLKDALLMVKQNDIEGLYGVSKDLTQCQNIMLIEHSNQKAIGVPEVVNKIMEFDNFKKKSTNLDFVSKSINKAVNYGYVVNFCTKQYKAPRYLSPQHAHLALLLQILEQDYLHPEIRQKGGAYGANCSFRQNGTFSMSSYMDPNSTKTFETFDKCQKQFLQLDKINSLRLEEAKIKKLGEIDRVRLPQNEGVNMLVKNYSVEQYEHFRQTVKNCKDIEVIETGRKWLDGQGSRCIFGKDAPSGFVQEKLKDYLM